MGRKNLDKIFPMNVTTPMGMTTENGTAHKSRLASFMHAKKNLYLMGAPSGCEVAFKEELAKSKPKSLNIIVTDLELDKIGGLSNVIKLWNDYSVKDMTVYATPQIAENIRVILEWNRGLKGCNVVELTVNTGHRIAQDLFIMPMETAVGHQELAEASNPYRITMGNVSIAWLDRNAHIASDIIKGFNQGLYDYIYVEAEGDKTTFGKPSMNELTKCVPSDKREYVYIHGIIGDDSMVKYIRNLGFSIAESKK